MNRDDALYRGYRRGELERLYSHRHRIEGYDGYLERWPRESAAAREHLKMLPDIACGSRAAERYDVFPARPGAPVLVFFHGGYWHSQDKASFEFMAPAYVARGTAFVSANYPLCPEVTPPELLDACRRCVVHVRDHAESWGGDPARVFVSGHSAGGHIAACLMSTQWGNLRPDLPGDLVKGAVAVSGIYDLEPIRFLAMNDTLGIDAATARDCSPLRAVPRTAGPMVLAVGTGEGEEFNRQQADYAAAWRAAGLTCRTMVLEGENHFSIMDRFARQGTELFEAVCDLMGV